MPQKQPVTINFQKGLDLKTDPFQLALGNFLNLENSVFGKTGGLVKRNGFPLLMTLPDLDSTIVTTFNGNLTAIGTSLEAYNSSNETVINKGSIQPVELDTLSLIKSNTNQSQSDCAVAANGLVCTVFTDNLTSSTVIKYAIADSVTGQNIVAPQVIPTTTGTPTGSARVYNLGNYFIIIFTNLISATSHLQYIAININDPTVIVTNTDIAAAYIPASTLSWDAITANNNLYIAYNTITGGQQVQITYLTPSLALVAPVSYVGSIATMMSVTMDLFNPTTPHLYVSFYDLASHTGYTVVTDNLLNPVSGPTQIIPSGTILNLTSTAYNGVCTFLYEVSNNYSYDSSIPTHFIKSNTITQSGTVGTSKVLVRSVGLASKAFLYNGDQYFLGVYSSPYQPTYFLFNSNGGIILKLAYQNGPPYYTLGLPNVTLTGAVAQFSYLYKDLISAVNKDTNVSSGTQVNGIYSQTGVNLASVTLSTSNIITSEIGANLNITGGILWAYDGYVPVEQNFHLYPDSVEVTTATGSGSLIAQTYFYQVTYEWSDNQGNIFRSAPSIPVKQVTTTSSSTNTINVPTLRLTYKTANPVKIVIYRWSTAQQTYYQVTSISAPLINDPTVDTVQFVDTLSDASILGNNIIYTNGGVLENIGPPASSDTFLFDDRLWLIDAEDKNLLWYSKQVIEATPVEMTDLNTVYVAPTLSAQGSSGPLFCGAPMDDKAILFKKDAIYYFNGTGPDNTGANSQYSQPIFITSTVGCANPKSIVLIPNGLMFQSDKGIWLLGRDLSTKYIGAPVEAYNSSLVQSALTIPGTNQVRFTLDNGITLMYDYYFEQWGTFTGISGISSCLYQGMHTYLDKFGRIFQEKENTYLDGSNPVLLGFTTSWINLAGIQGYQRAYFFDLLGKYLSPHKLSLQIAYDYNPSPTQSTMISPDNYSPPWGSGNTWGALALWGGNSYIEQWKIHLQRQTCMSFQITLNEIFDASYGVSAGQGITLSGINLIIGIKSGYRPIKASNTAG